MIVPNADRAFVDDAKLLDYCLDPLHLRGRNKARLFEELLGINRRNMLVLKNALLEAVASNMASPGKRDMFGQRYVVDFELVGPAGRGIVRSAWLTTCYVL
jgi:hypothetical protein